MTTHQSHFGTIDMALGQIKRVKGWCIYLCRVKSHHLEDWGTGMRKNCGLQHYSQKC